MHRNLGWLRMSSFTVLFDACVLYSAPLRDLLVELSSTGLFRGRWTDAIHDEWTRSLLAKRPDLTSEQLARTRELMNRAVPGGMIADYEKLIEGLELPDPGDRHVLAAAIVGRVDLIVTWNLKHFPADALGTYRIHAKNPDDFLFDLLDIDERPVMASLATVRARLKSPSRKPKEYLETLEAQGLPKFVAAVWEEAVERL
jgi:hypothetical protein